MISLPSEFEDRMKNLAGFDIEKYKKEIKNNSAVKAFHVNGLKISGDELENTVDFPTKKVEFTDDGYYFEHEYIGKTPLHHAGAFYVQEPSAMCPVAAVDIKPDWKVLDMCASPGGKSIQIANKLEKDGALISNEIVPSRCKKLVGNFERMGIRNAVVTNADSATVGKWYENVFDLVLVDAPCSGEGMFRKSESAIADWSMENVIMCAERQAQILQNVAGTVKAGGYLLYSTCTFSLEENEMNVDRFLRTHPEFVLQKLSDSIVANTAEGIKFDCCAVCNISYTRRFYPYISKGEGQFIALMKKNGDVDAEPDGTATSDTSERILYKNGCRPLTKEEMKITRSFLHDIVQDYENLFNDDSQLHGYGIKKYNNNIVIVSDIIPVPEYKVFSCGVKIGEIIKNRIVPHHQFFMAYGNYFKRKINLDCGSGQAAQYIGGMGFDCPNIDDGWASVLINNCTVGGAKVVNGYVKNHYPKGLRDTVV